MMFRVVIGRSYLIAHMVHYGDVIGVCFIGVRQQNIIRYKLHRVQPKLHPLISNLLGQDEILLRPRQMRQSRELSVRVKRVLMFTKRETF